MMRDKLDGFKSILHSKQKNHSGLKSEISEDAPQTISNEKMLGNWLDEIYTDFEKTGGFEDLPGKGKPIEVRTLDPLNSVLKSANVLPSWLNLQHEIRDTFYQLIKQMDSTSSQEHKINNQIIELNKKIAKYNSMVPSSFLQKSKITMEDIKNQYDKWL